MKSMLFFLTCVFFCNLSLAQSDQNDLLNKIPAVPANICNTSKENQDQYSARLAAIIRELNSQIQALKKQSKPDEAQAKNQAEQMLKQQGLSQEEIAKMKSKKMSKEDKQAMVSKMMGQSTNMSMEEINQMKNMSKEGKKAYAEGYAAEGQATAQANAGKTNESATSKPSSAESITQRSILYQKIKDEQQKILDMYLAVDKNPEGLKTVDKINALKGRMGQLVGGGGEGGWNPKDKKEYDAAAAQVKQLEKVYCQQMTPLYVNALNSHLSNLKSSYNDYQQLDEMTGKIDNTVVTIGTKGKGGNIEYFDWVKEYVSRLQDVYRYSPVGGM